MEQELFQEKPNINIHMSTSFLMEHYKFAPTVSHVFLQENITMWKHSSINPFMASVPYKGHWQTI